MIHTKLTFTATIVFSGEMDELPNVQEILDMLATHQLDIEYVHAQNTIGNNFVIMLKPKGQTGQTEQVQEDIPF